MFLFFRILLSECFGSPFPIDLGDSESSVTSRFWYKATLLRPKAPHCIASTPVKECSPIYPRLIQWRRVHFWHVFYPQRPSWWCSGDSLDDLPAWYHVRNTCLTRGQKSRQTTIKTATKVKTNARNGFYTLELVYDELGMHVVVESVRTYEVDNIKVIRRR